MLSLHPSVKIHDMPDLLDGLNEQQKQAVAHDQGPLLIVAGAGTGKTTVLTRRFLHLVQSQNLPSEAVLAVTFTDKAAGEMEDRVLQLLPTGTYDLWISTFHGFCQRVLEAHGLEIGLPNEFRLLSTTDAWLLLKRRFDELPLDLYRPLGQPVKFLRGLLQHISRAKDEGVTPEKYVEFARDAVLDGDAELVDGERKRLSELAALYAAYRKMLLEEGCLDFGDLILETLRLFHERPAVLEQYRRQFRYVLVDEFQDTNWAQYELIKLLAGEGRNVTVVGDDDQAIYKFRGASLANILQFRDDYPDAKTISLVDNYRSRTEILEAAYRAVRHNDPDRLEVKLADTGLTKQLVAQKKEGGRVEALWFQTLEEEADGVADRIKQLKKDSPTLSWNDIAILVRSNDGAEPFVRALERKQIPFQFFALRGLYATPTAVDMLALLSLLDGSFDSTAAWRVFQHEHFHIPSEDLAKLTLEARRKGISLWQAGVQARALGISQEGVRLIESLVGTVHAASESARRDPPLRVLQQLLNKTGYLGWVMRLPEREKRDRLQHLNGFAERIRRYEAMTHGPSLRGFLQELRLEIESGEEGGLHNDPDAGPELVKIMTIHAAKGLEFAHVFVVSLVDRRFPTIGRNDAIPLPDGLVQERLPTGDAHIAEERRLYYVALTRAKETLTLTGASFYGGSREKKPSIFFAEAGVDPVQVGSSEEERAKRLAADQETDTVRPTDVVHYDLKKKFSFTQLAAFKKCPLQYKFEHIYRIPKFGNEQKTFGQSIHLTFQKILDLHRVRTSASQGSLFDLGGGNQESGIKNQELATGYGLLATGYGLRVTEDEAMEIFEAAWIDEWYETRKRHDEYKAKGKAAVRAFCHAYTEKIPDIQDVEKDFTLVLGKHSIKGKIDRIDRLADGSVEVIDYKTGEAKEKLDADAKEQLHLYQVALEEKGVKVGKLTYLYVGSWTELAVEPLDEKTKEGFIEKLCVRMDAIVQSDFRATPEPFVCKFCDFRMICEERKL